MTYTPNETALDERKRRILSAVVRDYITTAEPVGSKHLVERYSLGISPATVRNELAVLERSGYLMQPHTSAGRVPTDMGYRFYVDYVVDSPFTPTIDDRQVSRYFQGFSAEIGTLMRETSELLSRLTSYAAVVFAPNVRQDKLKHIDLVVLNAGRVLIVIITSAGSVLKQVVEVELETDASRLHRTELFLNQHLVGRTFAGVLAMKLPSSALPEDDRPLVEQLLKAIVRCLIEKDSDRVYYGGAANLLALPEFESLIRVQRLLDTLEHSYQLLELFSEVATNYSLVVRIGAENERLNIEGCSLIASSYKVHGQAMGALGVLGPTRMDYSRAIGAVRSIARELGETLEVTHEWSGD